MALIFYQEMNAEANRVARVAHDIMGLKVRDTVAYLQVNTPEYISTVFGTYWVLFYINTRNYDIKLGNNYLSINTE